jgi:plasmid maintenance system killer protein
MYQVRDKCIQIHTEQKKQRRFRHLPSLVLQNLRHYIQKYKIRVSDVWSICRKAKGKDEAVNGLIQPIHLQKGLALMGYELSLTETQSLFSYIDINQDGFI